LQEQLKDLVRQAETDISACQSPSELMNVKAMYLGKKSQLNGLFAKMRELAPEERPAFGNLINESRGKIEAMLESKGKEIKENAWEKNSQSQETDLTMPGVFSSRGGFHPLSIVRREIDDVFMSMGFEIAEGPDIDDDFHNFDALNTPADHPSRNLADTFYLEGGGLLRSQTSTVQIRVMEAFKPPIRIISPGRCYRNDKPDPSHSPVFHQVEALVVDKGISLADMTDTLSPICLHHVWEKGLQPDQTTFLSLYRAQRRNGYFLRKLWWKRLPDMQILRLAGNGRSWNGGPQCIRYAGYRFRNLHRICLWTWHRADCHAEI